jgi:hypothetical protein
MSIKKQYTIYRIKRILPETLDSHEIATNSFSVLSVSSVVNSAEFGLKLFERVPIRKIPHL